MKWPSLCPLEKYDWSSEYCMNAKMEISDIIENALVNRDSKITALPLMCGAGKSSAISVLIMRAIEQKRGLMIITDRKYRFEQYINPQNDIIKKFIKKHKTDCISIIKSGTVKHDTEEARKSPVVMMTSQRFFNLTEDELALYLVWNQGDKKRTMLVFDEKPELYFQYKLDEKSLESFDYYFKAMLVNQDYAIKAKRFLSTWNEIYASLKISLKKAIPANEKLKHTYSMVNTDHYGGNGNLNTNSSRILFKQFLLFLFEHKLYFQQNGIHFDIWGFINALRTYDESSQLHSYWRINHNTFENYYFILKSNLDKLKKIEANTVILDGTAPLSIDYKQEGIKIDVEACKSYERKLHNLTIVLADCKTTKTEMKKWSPNILSFFIYFLDKYSNGAPVCCFSYKDLINFEKQQEMGDCLCYEEDDLVKTEYFGNIKGKNEFKKYTILGQVGIFQRPVPYYLGRFIDQDKALRNKLINSKTQLGRMEAILRSKKYENIVCQDIIADIEQNIFRSKIREEGCTSEIKYFVFYDFTNHIELKEQIVKRFSGHYEAKIEAVNAYSILQFDKILRRKGTSIAKRLLLECQKIPRGKAFHIDEWLKSIDIQKSQFDSAKQCNKCIEGLFNSWKTGKRGIYIKH